MDETKGWHHSHYGHCDVASRLHERGGVVDRLVGDVGCVGVLSVVASALPRHTVLFCHQLVRLLQPGPLDSAKGRDIPAGWYSPKAPGVHAPSDVQAGLL